MNAFSFYNPVKLIFGKGQLKEVKKELPKFGKKVLVVYGGGSIKKNGLYDEVMAVLKEAGLEVFELSGVEPNPRISTARKGIEICKNEGIDMLLAVGGGSVIDCTKLIACGLRSRQRQDGAAGDQRSDLRRQAMERAFGFFSGPAGKRRRKR
jgi:alcohol dehydrogenase YqhD (iron-dependent ADH family)